MKRIFTIILIFTAIPWAVSAQDYQYQYFQNKEKDGKVPFSDYIPKVRNHFYTVPHYVEDYYQLYSMKQYYNETSLRQNIERLKTALNCNFRHPSQALVKVESEAEYQKYRTLMFMHINLLIMRNYLMIGARYDKFRVKFYDKDFAQDLLNSMKIAESFYNDAIPYWKEADKYARKASEIKTTTDFSIAETERVRIIRGELDYSKIISGYISKIREKEGILKGGVK